MKVDLRKAQTACSDLTDQLTKLTVEKEAAWRVADSVFRGAASIARELGAKLGQEEASMEAKHPPKALAAPPTMAPLQVWSL